MSKITYKKELLLVIILFIITLALRLPMYHSDFWQTPDAIEYVNVANQISSGQGLTQSIKWHFFSNTPVVTSAFEGKPFLSSIIFAPIVWLTHDVYSLQLFLFIVIALDVILFYLLCRQYLTVTFSFLAAFLFAINPDILIANRMILSEPIFYFFVFSAFILYGLRMREEIKYSLLGIIIALAYLTRSEGIFLFFIFLLFSLRKVKQMTFMIFTFFITVSPYLYVNYQINGSPFYSYVFNHFRVHSFSEGMSSGFGKKFPSITYFISHNTQWIIHRILILFLSNIESLISFAFLGGMTIFIFFAAKKKIIVTFAPILLLSLLTIVNYSLFWSAFSEPERHLAIAYILILLPLFYGVQKLERTKKLFALSLIVLTIFIYTVYDIHRIQWVTQQEAQTDPWRQEQKGDIYSVIKSKTKPDAIIASTNPWMVYLNTRRPSIFLPDTSNQKKDYDHFVKEYNVSFILFDGENKINGVKIYSSKEGSIYKVK